MTPELIRSILKPFKDVADLVDRELNGIPRKGDLFLQKSFMVNGEEQQTTLAVDHFHAARDLYDQLGEYVKDPQPPAPKDPPPAPQAADTTTLGDKTEADVKQPDTGE